MSTLKRSGLVLAGIEPSIVRAWLAEHTDASGPRSMRSEVRSEEILQ